MKLAVLAVLLVPMVPAGAPVSFDSDSVRVGDVAVTDIVMQLKETPSGFVLASKGSVETLARPVSVPLPPDDGLRWYESPAWYAAVRLSGLLPDLAEIAGRAWILDTVRWVQEQADVSGLRGPGSP